MIKFPTEKKSDWKILSKMLTFSTKINWLVNIYCSSIFFFMDFDLSEINIFLVVGVEVKV